MTNDLTLTAQHILAAPLYSINILAILKGIPSVLRLFNVTSIQEFILIRRETLEYLICP